MSRRARARMQHPRRVAVNTMEIAASRARKLSRSDIDQQVALVRLAVAEFCRGQHCAQHWRSLADTANMAETLAGMRMGAGDAVDELVGNTQQALHDVFERQASSGIWTLFADEIDALLWLAPLHQAQLEACSYGEFETAYDRTMRRLAQALAGNAAPGTIVVVGDMPAAATAGAAV